MSKLDLTVEALKAAKFRGPVRFYDGYGGMARQDFVCVDEPRFGYFWRRENRKDDGRQAYMVDGAEVASLEEACQRLSAQPDPNSPDQRRDRMEDEFFSSPKLNYGATRALSEARCNGDAAPFGTLRAWMRRSQSPWHSGINRHADNAREAGEDFPHWLYNTKSAAHETYRGMYLFAGEREKDTGLKCAKGVSCRQCAILGAVEKSMTDARSREKLAYELEDTDIDAAKVWTCIGHILSTEANVVDGVFFTTKRDRESGDMW